MHSFCNAYIVTVYACIQSKRTQVLIYFFSLHTYQISLKIIRLHSPCEKFFLYFYFTSYWCTLSLHHSLTIRMHEVFISYYHIIYHISVYIRPLFPLLLLVFLLLFGKISQMNFNVYCTVICNLLFFTLFPSHSFSLSLSLSLSGVSDFVHNK